MTSFVSICFVKGCDTSTCGAWGACSAGCNAQGIETRVCSDPLCGPAEEQRPCTGPCMYFLTIPGKSVVINLVKTATLVPFTCHIKLLEL